MGVLEDLIEGADNLYDVFAGATLVDDYARVVAGGFRGECLEVRAPGIPFGEYLARGASWWASQASDFLSPVAEPIRREHERVTAEIQEFLGVPVFGGVERETKPRFSGFGGPTSDGFLVQIPGWQDIFTLNNELAFDT